MTIKQTVTYTDCIGANMICDICKKKQYIEINDWVATSTYRKLREEVAKQFGWLSKPIAYTNIDYCSVKCQLTSLIKGDSQ